MEACLDNMASLLDSAATLSEMRVHRRRRSQDCVWLGSFIDSIGRQYLAAAAARGLRLRVRAYDGCARIDIGGLSHIVNNLISNSLEATQSGSVLLVCRRRDRGLYLEVWDTGQGMNPVQAQKAGLRSAGPATAKTGKKGGGFGLYVVRELCEMEGLTFNLKSHPQKGTLARIFFPSETLGQRRRHVAVVAKHDQTQLTLMRYLRRWGFSTSGYDHWSDATRELGSANRENSALVICEDGEGRPESLMREIDSLREQGVTLATIYLAEKASKPMVHPEVATATLPATDMAALRTALFRLLPSW